MCLKIFTQLIFGCIFLVRSVGFSSRTTGAQFMPVDNSQSTIEWKSNHLPRTKLFFWIVLRNTFWGWMGLFMFSGNGGGAWLTDTFWRRGVLNVPRELGEVVVTCLIFRKLRLILKRKLDQIDSSTIDGNVEFVHSQYSCILSSQVSVRFMCQTKSLIIVTIL